MQRYRKLGPIDYRRSGLPELYWNARLDCVPERVRPVIARYVAHLGEMMKRPAGLLLTGPSGVGKTSIAAIILKAARAQIPKGYTAYFTSCWELREAIKNRSSYDEEQTVLDRVREVDLLILDGLRADDAKDPYHLTPRVMEEIILTRGAQRRPTLLTTSLTRRDLTETYTSLLTATADVLVTLEVVGASQREAQARQLRSEILGK